MIQRFSTNFAIFSITFDFLTTLVSLYLSKILRPWLGKIGLFRPMNEPFDIPLLLFVLFPLIWVSILFFFSVYDGKKNLKAIDEFTYLSIGSLLAVITMAGFLYLSFRDIPRGLFTFFVVLTYFSMVIWRIIAHVLYRRRISTKNYRTKLLIIGAGPVGKDLRKNLGNLDPLTYHFVGFLDDSNQKKNENKEVIGPIDDLVKIIENEHVDHVFIALPRYANERMAFVTKQLQNYPVRISVIPDYFDLTVQQTTVSEFAGMPVLDLRAPALTESQRLAKRIFDIFFTSIMMIFALPIMGIVALLILIFDGRPVLLKQNRVGENGQIIKIFKFRTMVVGAEKMTDQVATKTEDGKLIIKRPDDPRITPLGRILRKLSLDELPQFFNILRGTMSLIGPRPELPELVNQYEPWQRARFSIPQGLTGWWQVSGRSDKPMHLNTEYDLYYIEHYSILLDFSILVKTFWIALTGKGAY